MFKLMYLWGKKESRKPMRTRLGKQFAMDFSALSSKYMAEMLPQVPDIGKRAFRFNYAYAPVYIAWSKALCNLGLDQDAAIHWVWEINERMLVVIPRPILHFYGRHM